jgi:hypothetical protein
VLETLALYAILSAALFYLGSRALITRALWSRYPPRLAAFMDCSACTGFWWGLILAIAFGRTETAWALPHGYFMPVVVGASMIALTPIVAGFMQYGLDRLGAVGVYDSYEDFPAADDKPLDDNDTIL